jgi:hypothetical protein
MTKFLPVRCVRPCQPWILLLALLAVALPALAQNPPAAAGSSNEAQPSAEMSSSKPAGHAAKAAPAEPYTLPFRLESLGLWSGYSPDSMKNIGKMPDRKLFVLSGEARWVLLRGRRATLYNTFGLVPAAVITQPAEYYAQSTTQLAPGRVLYGAGATPLGLQLNCRNTRRVQPFINSTAGFLYFNRQVPVVYSSQFNFTFDLGGGVEVRGEHGSWSLGYRYHHISNANTGTRNPGVDSSLLWTGYRWGRR